MTALGVATPVAGNRFTDEIQGTPVRKRSYITPVKLNMSEDNIYEEEEKDVEMDENYGLIS